MHIPTRYIGRWRGEIFDVTRTNKYDGEIVLGLGEVSTTYFMAQGKKEGKLDLQCEADGFLVVKETAGSFKGTLLLYLDADSNLKCVWRSGSKFNSEATMTRIEPAYSNSR